MKLFFIKTTTKNVNKSNMKHRSENQEPVACYYLEIDWNVMYIRNITTFYRPKNAYYGKIEKGTVY
jgi:hypothetical protein